MDEQYETKISNVRWLAYDIPGNAGWILWMVCTVLCLKEGFTLFSALSLLPALLMLIGVCELVSERIAGLDRLLPKKRLYRGFGALTMGGFAGIPIALGGLLAGSNGNKPLWMLLGAILCAAFAYLCFKGYRRQHF